jgi:REP element-mobilizing transposase RayT
MTYWRLHYHLIWATHEREPHLTPKFEEIFYGVLKRKVQELGVKLHAAGNVPNHVHLVVSIPPKLAVAKCVRHFKGATAFTLNKAIDSKYQFQWQVGYGALTLGERSLEKVMAYAANQKQHHQTGELIQVYEKIDEE